LEIILTELVSFLLFFNKWIFIIFEFGGLGFVIYLLTNIKEDTTVNSIQLRSAIKMLIPFILTAIFALSNMWYDLLGLNLAGLLFQLANNIATGLLFIFFLNRIKKGLSSGRQ